MSTESVPLSVIAQNIAAARGELSENDITFLEQLSVVATLEEFALLRNVQAVNCFNKSAQFCDRFGIPRIPPVGRPQTDTHWQRRHKRLGAAYIVYKNSELQKDEQGAAAHAPNREWENWPPDDTAVLALTPKLIFAPTPLTAGTKGIIEYMELWILKKLFHLRTKREKPSYLPSPENLGYELKNAA